MLAINTNQPRILTNIVPVDSFIPTPPLQPDLPKGLACLNQGAPIDFTEAAQIIQR